MELTEQEEAEVKGFFPDGPIYVEYAESAPGAVVRSLACSGRNILCAQRDRHLLIYRIWDKVMGSTQGVRR